MAFIPPGDFYLGIDPTANTPSQFMTDRTASMNAQPMQKMHLEGFYIDLHEVTYEQFIKYKASAKYEVTHFQEPIRGISWYEADAYCHWLGKRLPTEFEWEKAARGKDQRLFVWGNDFDKEYANFGRKVVPINSHNTDVSPYGISDMNGNVAEWTASWFQPYPNSKSTDKNFGQQFKVIRGGNTQKQKHGFLEAFVMIPYRNALPPEKRFWDVGFRCAKTVTK
jgi:formylglycine-generating enzyme required for sulfatase activity